MKYVICKKTVETSFGFLYKDFKYKLISENTTINNYKTYTITGGNFNNDTFYVDYFYTDKEIRKMKLEKMKEIEIQIPRNFMNCAITVNNKFIADTNNSKDFDELLFPLPEPIYKWNIKSYDKKLNKNIIILIDKE